MMSWVVIFENPVFILPLSVELIAKLESDGI